MGKSGEGGGVAHDGLVAQALDQLASDARVHGRHQPQPQARQMRGEDGHRDHRPPQAALAGVLAHQLAVGHAIGAADLDHAAALHVEVGRLQQVLDGVLDRDRLGARVHPARRDHHRQPVDQGADHLERHAPGADHDRRAQLDGGDPRGREGGAHLLAARQVVRQAGSVAEPAQVHDAAHPRRARRGAERGRPVAIGPAVVLAPAHRVHQVVGRVDPLERRRERGGIAHVAGHDLGLRRGARRELGRAPAHAAHPPAGLLEAAQQAPAHVAARSGEQQQGRVRVAVRGHDPQGNLAGAR